MKRLKFLLVIVILGGFSLLQSQGDQIPTPAGAVISVDGDAGVIGEPDEPGDLVGEVDNGVVIVAASAPTLVNQVFDFGLVRQIPLSQTATVNSTAEARFRLSNMGNGSDTFGVSATASASWFAAVKDLAGNVINSMSVPAGASADFLVAVSVPPKAFEMTIVTLTVKDGNGSGMDDGWGIGADTQSEMFSISAIPAAFHHLEVIQPARVVAGEPIQVRVKAADVYGNLRRNDSFKGSLTAYLDQAASATGSGTLIFLPGRTLQGIGWSTTEFTYTKAERIFLKAVSTEGVIGSNLVDGALAVRTEVKSIQSSGSASGSLTLAYVNPGASQDETWTLVFVSDSVYSIQGSVSGENGLGSIFSDSSSLNGALTVPRYAWQGAFKTGDAFVFAGTRGTLIDPGPAARFRVTASPKSLKADGSATSALTSIFWDQFSNPILPAAVSFSLKPPELGSLAPTRASTFNGEATTLMTSIRGKIGPALITASVIGTRGATVSGTVPLFFALDASNDLTVRAPGAPTIFVPAGALPDGVTIDVRKPEEWNIKDKIGVEDTRKKIEQAFARAKKGKPADLVTLAIPNNIWQFTAWKDGEVWSGKFNGKGLQLQIPYPDADADGTTDVDLPAKLLRLFWLNEGKQPAEWEVVSNFELQADLKEIWVWVDHFSIYSLQGIKPPLKEPETLKFVSVYPNPFLLDEGKALTFINLPPPDKIEFLRIYNLAGELVAELNDGNMNLANLNNDYRSNSAAWNGKTRNGRKVASGIYVYVIKSLDEDKPRTGKIGVVK